MTARILKKIRSTRSLHFVVGLLILVVAFQNCAPPANEDTICAGTNCDKKNATAASTNSASASSTSTNVETMGTGSSSTGTSSGTNTTTSPSPPTSTESAANSLRFVTQPQNVNVAEGASFQLTVNVAGGTAPYVLRWYKDNQPINIQNVSYTFSDQANRYSKEGAYYLKVTDATGTTIQSSTAQVTITETTGPCDATKYMMFNAPGKDNGLDMLGLFENPHGKFLINKNNTEVNWMNSNPKTYSISYFNFTPALQNGQTATISCLTTIPRIHTPAPNPITGIVQNNALYKYEGQVTFVCQNQKYKFVSDTCAWVRR